MEFLGLKDIQKWLIDHGQDPKFVNRKTGIRIVLGVNGNSLREDEAYIELTTFKLNAEGKMFIDAENPKEAASERKMIRLQRFP